MSDIIFTTQTTPATPGSGKADVFVDSSTKQIKSVNDAGVVATYLTEAGHNVAAAVHGLPASVNVLGNRSAAGEFVQRATAANANTSANNSLDATWNSSAVITYPVAFTSAPYVVGVNKGTDVLVSIETANVTTTTFSLFAFYSSNVVATLGWIALGA